MSTPRIEDTLLQRLLDGDLAGSEHDRVMALLDESDVDRGRQQALERLSGFIGDVATEDAAQLSQAESAGLFDAIWAGIEAPAGTSQTASESDAPADEGSAPRKRPKLRLIEGEGLGTLPPRSEKVAFEPKLGHPDGAGQKPLAPAAPKKTADQGARWPGLVAVAALAAAALLAIALRPDENPRAEIVVPDVVVPSEDPEVVVEDDPEVIVATHLGTEVEEVDFGTNIGTVFQVPGEQDVPVAVVWISDEEYVR